MPKSSSAHTASIRAKTPTPSDGCGAECEDAKRTLSARVKTTLGCDYQGHAVRVEVTRDKFVELTRDLLDRTSFTARQTLQAAGLKWTDLDHVLLVGGSTRMPMVIEGAARSLRQNARRFGLGRRSGRPRRRPAGRIHAGQAPWQGRALQNSSNVNSHSLGVAGTDPQTRRKRNAIFIPRNTPLPVSAKRMFKTSKPGQKSVLVQIVEGESASPDDCSQIGKCTIRGLPKDLPAETPIEVRFRYEENGRLTVQVTVGGTEGTAARDRPREHADARPARWLASYITGTAGGGSETTDEGGTKRWS